MRISDWSSDVCSSDLRAAYDSRFTQHESEVYAGASVAGAPRDSVDAYFAMRKISIGPGKVKGQPAILLNNEPVFQNRSEEHTSELQSLMRISYAVFCLKKKK